MAEKVGAPDKAAPKKPPKTHNMAELAKKLDPFLNDICKGYDKMEEDHGSHVLTLNHKFDAIAEKIGFPKALIRKQVAAVRRAEKAAKALKESTGEELDVEIELLEGVNATTRGRDLFTHRLEILKNARKGKD